jgi:hypothetical protein
LGVYKNDASRVPRVDRNAINSLEAAGAILIKKGP